MQEHPPGTILITGSDLSRYTAFSLSLIGMHRPAGTVVSWITGANIAKNLNDGLDMLHGEWVWRIDDDQVFTPSTLMRLLAHDVDLVAPLVMHRKPPFEPVAYREQQPDGKFLPWAMTDIPQYGLHPVAATGGSGLLIRRRVFEALEKPYFEIGQLKSDDLSEDLYFHQKARAAGFQAWLDVETSLGHLTPMVVWPLRGETEGWVPFVDTAGSLARYGVGRSQQGSHHDALLWCLRASTGPVLEIGMGVESTPFLHHYCGAHGRSLVSLETAEKYTAEFQEYATPTHRLVLSESDEAFAVLRAHPHWGVVFIDGEADARGAQLSLATPSADFLVLHDTEPSHATHYHYTPRTWEPFPYLVIDKRGTPWTTVCSMTKDLTPLREWLAREGNPD